MKKIDIIDSLCKIEKKYNIKILYSCESGSRAWGFPSPSSDFDVRFIYVKNIKDYLSVGNLDLQIGIPISNDLDLVGWDLKKVLQLIKKSNTTPFEWLQSPIIYTEIEGFRQRLFKLCENYFHQRSNVFHYIGVAKSALNNLNGNTIKIKKLFYILRPLLAAMWCLKNNQIAPMEIKDLLINIPLNISSKIIDLIEFKKNVAEDYPINLEQELKEFIFKNYENCLVIANSLEIKSFSLEPLNEFFLTELDLHKI
ncbi:nucleotidyltransferase domain-containing protein [Apibacter muscae]|uniref:Nucleotidyltransferase domain-containing protein n=1 Tax=Apibacter muscae TaxID=2509004 RepID=A0A563D8E9_9FLAO|nr:nucleotidyltransferase domain-containing protein [Apibacter muscae]TWP26211.1 nucleotidyltransferase domain-containing protein [Apibacter muscae]